MSDLELKGSNSSDNWHFLWSLFWEFLSSFGLRCPQLPPRHISCSAQPSLPRTYTLTNQTGMHRKTASAQSAVHAFHEQSGLVGTTNSRKNSGFFFFKARMKKQEEVMVVFMATSARETCINSRSSWKLYQFQKFMKFVSIPEAHKTLINSIPEAKSLTLNEQDEQTLIRLLFKMRTSNVHHSYQTLQWPWNSLTVTKTIMNIYLAQQSLSSCRVLEISLENYLRKCQH